VHEVLICGCAAAERHLQVRLIGELRQYVVLEA